MNRVSRFVAIAAVLVAVATTFVVAQQPAPRTAALSGLSLDTLADGAVVVTLIATGDDFGKGLATFQFQPNGSGGYDGTWALALSYADNTDPATGEEPPFEEHPHTDSDHPHADGDGDDHPAHDHQDFLRLVDRGSLQGSVTGAQLTFNAEGALTDFTAPLTVTQGFKEFAGATGSGDASLGALTLTF